MLLDECIDAQVAFELSNCEVRTIKRLGWRGKKNGELLRLAAADFDVFVTIDQGLRFQQPVSKLHLGAICLEAPSNEFEALRPLMQRLRHAVMKVKPGQVIRLAT